MLSSTNWCVNLQSFLVSWMRVFMILVECSFNARLLWVTLLFPGLRWPNGKRTAPPPVDLSILLLRQLDQCHGNLDRLDVGRRWVFSRRPPHLTLSGTRCLGQVLVLSQVELLSEHRHIKDLHSRTLKWKLIILILDLERRGNSHKLTVLIRKGYIEVLSSSSCRDKKKRMNMDERFMKT